MCSLAALMGARGMGSEDSGADEDVPSAATLRHPWCRHGLLAVPDHLLLNILESISVRSQGSSTTCLLVSATWRHISTAACRVMRLRSGARLASAELMQQLSAFPNLTSLHVSPGSLLKFDDALLSVLPLHAPGLRVLAVDKSAAVEMSLTPRGLVALSSALPSLHSLLLPDMGYAMSLPADVTSLRGLTALQCLRVRSLPGEFWALTALRRLCLGSSTVPELPPSLSLLTELRSLRLDLADLESLPEALVAAWRQLRSCAVTSRALTQLPGSFSGLRELRRLHLNCRELEELPPGLEALPRLRRMRLFARALKALPSGFARLTALQVLETGIALNALSHSDLSDPLGPPSALPPSLHRLHSSPPLPPSLHTLRVSSFWGQDLPAHICALPLLRALSIEVCPSLRALPPALGSLARLQEVAVDLCALESLPPSLCSLSGLRRLSLSNCARFRKLPEQFGSLSGLTELRVEGCSVLEGLPESCSRLECLAVLSLFGCHSVQALPPALGLVRSLRVVEIVRCGALQALPPSLGALHGLQRLVLENNAALVSLPESLSRLTGLNEFLLSGCPRLGRIPPGIIQLRSLPPAMKRALQLLSSEQGPSCIGSRRQRRKWLLSLVAA